nr:IS630 family transposase [Haloarcula argentinensis]
MRPGCPGRQPGRSTTNPTRELKKPGKKASKKARQPGRRIHGPDHRSDASSALDADLCVVSRRRAPVTPGDGRVGQHQTTRCNQRFRRDVLLPCEENFNSDTTNRLLDAPQTEFGEKICVILDNASYFTANAVQEFVEDTPIELCYLPRGSPELNPAEECWRQLDQELGNRLFDTLDDLRDAALTALDRIEVPDVFTYLCP